MRVQPFHTLPFSPALAHTSSMTKTSSAAHKAHETRRRNRIEKIERELRPIVRDALEVLKAAGMPTYQATSGTAGRSSREWVEGIGRRGAIGGHAGRYIDRDVAVVNRRTAAEAKAANRELAEKYLVEAAKTATPGSKLDTAGRLIAERDELLARNAQSLETRELWLAGI